MCKKEDNDSKENNEINQIKFPLSNDKHMLKIEQCKKVISKNPENPYSLKLKGHDITNLKYQEEYIESIDLAR